MNKKITFKIPHKVIISGEFSCIFGHPVLTSTIPLYLTVTLVYGFRTKNTNITVITSENGIMEFSIEDNEYKKNLIKHLFKQMVVHLDVTNDIKDYDIDLSFGPTSWVSYGLGSSANFLVGIFISICEVTKKPYLDQEWLVSNFEFLKSLEDQFHGKSSGIDILTILKSEFALYIKKENQWMIPYTVKNSKKIWMLLIKSHKPKNTKAAVSDLIKQLETEKQKTQNHINNIGKTTMDIFNSLTSDKSGELHSLLNQNQKLLEELNLSDYSIDCIINRLSGLKLGGKLTGGGRGGCVISLLTIDEYDEQKDKIDQEFGKDHLVLWFFIDTGNAPTIERTELDFVK